MNQRHPRILVSAGPTREFFDDVRYISNLSTGKMGYAIASAAIEAGAEVTLVSGPVELTPPKKLKKLERVVTGDEMRAKVLKHAATADVVIMTAAVADYRPERKVSGKMKKSGKNLTVRLVPTPDIIAEVGKNKRPGQILVGFALEATDHEKNARKKLAAKNLDLIVLNSIEAMGADKSELQMISADGKVVKLHGKKTDTARKIIAAVLSLVRRPQAIQNLKSKIKTGDLKCR